jgi:transposase
VARSTVQDNLKRTAAAGLAWPLADNVTDDALELRLFGRAGVETDQRRRIEPEWAALAREVKRPGVTRMILGRNIGRSTKRVAATAGSAICFAGSSDG